MIHLAYHTNLNDDEEPHLIGVFSTLDKAIDYAQRKNFPLRECWIETRVVDEPESYVIATEMQPYWKGSRWDG